ncbi:hypothetical protein J6590_106586 [Homalodisca vitripennis]|nr:hypothetical protein J6590_068179 [Homalodisca vitripennis]KAG8294281.1 hypothetical protein J6590_106586 [Homalodisca vitripennis]
MRDGSSNEFVDHRVRGAAILVHGGAGGVRADSGATRGRLPAVSTRQQSVIGEDVSPGQYLVQLTVRLPLDPAYLSSDFQPITPFTRRTEVHIMTDEPASSDGIEI